MRRKQYLNYENIPAYDDGNLRITPDAVSGSLIIDGVVTESNVAWSYAITNNELFYDENHKWKNIYNNFEKGKANIIFRAEDKVNDGDYTFNISRIAGSQIWHIGYANPGESLSINARIISPSYAGYAYKYGLLVNLELIKNHNIEYSNHRIFPEVFYDKQTSQVVIIQDNTMRNIANSIRKISGYNGEMKASDMPTLLQSSISSVGVNEYNGGGVFIAHDPANISKDMSNAFWNNITGVTKLTSACYPACGASVENMHHAYSEAKSFLIGYPVCGFNVIDMSYAYANCNYISGDANCGPNVVNMSHAYYGCTNINQAVCGSNVEDMSYAYYGCSNINKVVIGLSAVNMSYAYANCNRLYVKPLLSSIDYNLSHMFDNCNQLYMMSSPYEMAIDASDVSYMFSNVKYLDFNVSLGQNIINGSHMFYNCICDRLTRFNVLFNIDNMTDGSYMYYGQEINTIYLGSNLSFLKRNFENALFNTKNIRTFEIYEMDSETLSSTNIYNLFGLHPDNIYYRPNIYFKTDIDFASRFVQESFIKANINDVRDLDITPYNGYDGGEALNGFIYKIYKTHMQGHPESHFPERSNIFINNLNDDVISVMLNMQLNISGFNRDYNSGLLNGYYYDRVYYKQEVYIYVNARREYYE